MENNPHKLLDCGGELGNETIKHILNIYGPEQGMVVMSAAIGAMMGGSYTGIRLTCGRKEASDFLASILLCAAAAARLGGYELDIKITEKGK